MAFETWLYALLSVFVVSLVSLIGVVTLGMSDKLLNKILLFLVSFSAGSLFGGAFFHLIPEASSKGFSVLVPADILIGLIFFFVLEKFIHWRHCHVPTSKSHPHPVGMMNTIGDSFHNFIDGLVIGAAYITSIPLGFATTLAVIFHEVPQEMGDFGVLIHAGYKKTKALLFNFISALTAVLGAIVALLLGTRIHGFTEFLIPFTAGGFIYIAGSDLIPELQKEVKPGKSLLQFVALILGMGIMLVFAFFGEGV
jgi:zinc and cadmium transporter